MIFDPTTGFRIHLLSLEEPWVQFALTRASTKELASFDFAWLSIHLFCFGQSPIGCPSAKCRATAMGCLAVHLGVLFYALVEPHGMTP